VARAGTAPGTIAKLNRAFIDALEDVEISQRILALGADPTPTTPSEFAAFIVSEIGKWRQVALVSGAKEN